MALRTLLFAVLFGITAPALAADAAGVVKRLQGTVTLERDGKTLPVALRTEVQVGDRIVTGVDGLVGVTLADDTLLTAGQNSQLLINDFKFNTTTNEGSLLAMLVRGTLHVVTGLIAKNSPLQVEFRTPTLVLGVRGTEFIVDAGDGATP